jgi:hypothetical protein
MIRDCDQAVISLWSGCDQRLWSETVIIDCDQRLWSHFEMAVIRMWLICDQSVIMLWSKALIRLLLLSDCYQTVISRLWSETWSDCHHRSWSDCDQIIISLWSISDQALIKLWTETVFRLWSCCDRAVIRGCNLAEIKDCDDLWLGCDQAVIRVSDWLWWGCD